MSLRLAYLAAVAVLLGTLSETRPALQPGQDIPFQIPDDPATIRERHAEACVELAELELERRVAANRKGMRVFSEADIDRRRLNVRVARAQLDFVRNVSGDAVDVHLQHAAERAKVALSAWRKAERKDKAAAGSHTPLDLQQLRLKAEIAQLRLAIWSDPGTNVLSLLDHMHWQLERVSEDVIELQQRVDELSGRHE